MNRPLAKVLLINLLNGQDAHPTIKNNSCGMGKMPILVIFARGLMISIPVAASVNNNSGATGIDMRYKNF